MGARWKSSADGDENMITTINISGTNGARYLYRSGKGVNRRVMHIAEFNKAGEMTGQALCGIDYLFNISINAPFGLGRPVCKNCRKVNLELI